MNNCLYPDCERSGEIRGLCRKHYQAAERLVKGGETTWELMAEHGKCLPSSKGKHRKDNSWFLE